MSPVQKRPMEGQTVGKRYRIGRLLRSAAAGDVYACRDTIEENPELIIRITPVFKFHKKHEHLGSRMVLLQKLRHPLIEKIFDFGNMTETGGLFLVSGQAEGADFYSGTENSDPSTILTLFTEILHALRHMHTRGLVHGNLAPGSVLLFNNSQGRIIPFLRDFILMRRSNAVGDMRSLESICYAAPELLLEGREGKETDFYALGVLLYHALTRRLPFDDVDPDFLIQKQIQGNIDLDHLERIDGGEFVVPLLERLLEKAPEKRIQSIDEALALLPPQARRDFHYSHETKGRFSAAPFVEREKEMRLLMKRAGRVMESGRGWTVFISGEAGSGKTRCMEELRGWALLNGWRVAQGAFSVNEESPYDPYMQILGKTNFSGEIAKTLEARSSRPQFLEKCGLEVSVPGKVPEGFAISSSGKESFSYSEDISLVAEEVIAKGIRAQDSPTHIFEEAGEIPASPTGFPCLAAASASESSDYESAPERFQDRLTRELVRHFSDRPTLLFLNDIHLASREALTILEYLCSDIRTHPILICASFREGEISGDAFCGMIDSARRGERGEVVVLDPLTKNGVRQMISGLTGINKHQENLCDWMFRAVGGNPLFLEEMLEYLAEHEILRTQSGIWKIAARLPEEPDIPAGIGVIIRKRLARLSPQAMETLEWLSLFRRAAPWKYTELLTASNCETNEASLAELNKYRLLSVESSAGEKTISPGYELIAGVVRKMIPRERKHKMYREIAELLEKSAGKDGLYEAALHYTESPPDDRSVRCALTAVTGFQSVFEHENALRCFEYAFKYKDRLAPKEIFQAMITACDSMFALGEARHAIQLINSTLHFRGGVEPELKARLYLYLAMAYRHIGDWQGQQYGCRAGLRALRQFSPSGRFEETLLWSELAFGSVMRLRARAALRYLDRAKEACPDRNSPTLFGNVQNLYAILYCSVCEFNKAADAGEKAIAVLGHSNEHIQKCSALSLLGLSYMRRGRYKTALRLHLRASALSGKIRHLSPRAQADRNLAECLCRIGHIRKSFTAMEHAFAAAKESNNPTTHRACAAVAAGINLAACNYSETRRILKTLECDEKRNLSVFTDGSVDYLSAELNFCLGDFANALEDINKLRKKRTADSQLYEYEIAEALEERILFERDENPETVQRLTALENRVARKRWPYQRWLIKLHICEILIKMKRLEEAGRHARNALRLAKGMQSASLQCRAYLMMGISQSPLQRPLSTKTPICDDVHNAEDAIRSLNACLNLADASYSLECRWRALAELSFIYRFYKNYGLCFRYAGLAYKTLTRLEDQTPSDMLDSFNGVFGRSRTRLELMRLIEAERPFCRDTNETKCYKSVNTGILLRITELINTVREITPLLDGLLALSLSAIAVRRAGIFLFDETTGRLEQVGGREKEESRVFSNDVSQAILETVFQEGKPLVSADAGSDPRIMKNSFKEPPGKLLCVPLKTSERTIGVFYADCRKPVKNIGETEIDITKAFCSLTALAVENILSRRKLTQTTSNSCHIETSDHFPEIIGSSPAIRLLKERISLMAASPLDILITGESGSGKELVARAISNGDKRRNGKFIPVDCGALADGVAEAELFGCRKGAFTGASENRVGLLEAASGGVLFLDEISNMPMRLQVKLLRALQEREIRRIGDTLPRKIEIRVVAATNKDLVEEIKSGRFCHDLFYRLKAVEIHTPPLRERAEDIPILIESFLQMIFEQEKGVTRRFSSEAMELLRQYSYPGNIRELKNIVMTAYYSSTGYVIEAAALPQETRVRNVMETILSSTADNLYRRILAGDGGFEDLVKKPYLAHRFEAAVVTGVIRLALSDSSGIYKNAFLRLRIPKDRYATTMQFLKRHQCYLDFLPFRRDCECN